jgi:hypothetical protein
MVVLEQLAIKIEAERMIAIVFLAFELFFINGLFLLLTHKGYLKIIFLSNIIKAYFYLNFCNEHFFCKKTINIGHVRIDLYFG